MVLIEGGRTSIGSTVKEIEAIGQADELAFGRVVCETPQHTVDVEDFFIMVTTYIFAQTSKATSQTLG